MIPVIAILFVIAIIALFDIISVKEYEENDNIRAIGYPKGIIERDSKYFQVIEMHDFVRDTIYMDTVPYYRRMLSTLEDYDPQWCNINLIN